MEGTGGTRFPLNVAVFFGGNVILAVWASRSWYLSLAPTTTFGSGYLS